jgi:hypothetical protein
MTPQTQELPSSYNKDEIVRKIEVERQLIELRDKLIHLIDLNDQQTKLLEGFNARTTRLENAMFGVDFLNGVVQKVDTLTKMKTWILCTASALASAALTILVSYVVKHI